MDSYYRRSQTAHLEKKKRHFHWWIVIVIIVLAYAAWCLLRPLEPLTVSAAPARPASRTGDPKLSWPAGAESAIGTLGDGVLAKSSNNQKPLPTASIAKLITALTVLRQYPLGPSQEGPTITLSKKDVQIFNDYYKKNGSLVEIKAGEQISEHEALEAMLIPSGNNMADSLAIWAFDSLAQYRVAAQKEVQALGMTRTTIGKDASGFSPGTTSTPADLIKLGQAAMANPLLKNIVGAKSQTVPVAGKITNTNYLLGTSHIIGIKTGNSEAAGGNLLFAANYNVDRTSQVTIIGVIQHASNLLAAMKAATPLLLAAEHNFEVVKEVHSGQTIANFTAPWLSQPVPILAQQDISMPVWQNSKPAQEISTKTYKTPTLSSSFNTIQAGTIVGKLRVGGLKNKFSTSLIASRQIDPPSVLWRLTHPG